jgi:hypothetical protein
MIKAAPMWEQLLSLCISKTLATVIHLDADNGSLTYSYAVSQAIGELINSIAERQIPTVDK